MNTFEDRLLTELKAVVAEQAQQPEGKVRRLTSRPSFRSPSAGQRWHPRGVAAAGIAASVALAGAVAAAELIGNGAARPAASSQYSLVADFLNQAANAARTHGVPQPGPGQLYLTVSYEIGTVLTGKNGHWTADTSCDVGWYNASGQPIMFIGEMAPAGNKQCAGIPLYKPGRRFKPTATHWYPSPASLSHDPRTLLAQLDAAADRGPAYWSLVAGVGPQPTRDQIAFTLVERLLQAPIANDLRAALYRATIGIPGVTLNPHAVDALGRAGTGVSMPLPDGVGPVFTDEFILAKGSFAFLGTRDTAGGRIPMQDALARSAIVNGS